MQNSWCSYSAACGSQPKEFTAGSSCVDTTAFGTIQLMLSHAKLRKINNTIPLGFLTFQNYLNACSEGLLKSLHLSQSCSPCGREEAYTGMF